MPKATATATKPIFNVGPIKQSELEEADRILRLAFGTFLGLPNPSDFMGDRDFMETRWRAPHVKVIAARESGRLVGSNIVTHWGSFGFFGPLTVLPKYWDRGVAQQLLGATMKVFYKWGVRHTGLFTFAQSPKHVGLYQKFGYWPQYLTALMTRAPESSAAVQTSRPKAPILLSELAMDRCTNAIRACQKLTNKIDRGLDLSDEIQSVLAQRTGEVVAIYTGRALDGFAICLTGRGSEGGTKLCYIKFAAARGGAGAGARFDKLLDACDAFAASRGVKIEAGMNLAREEAYRRMRAHGYRVTTQGVAMQRPNASGFNRPDVFLVDDWR